MGSDLSLEGQLGNPFSSAPSFGLVTKKTVTLRSKLPPIYNAQGKTVAIKADDSLLTIAIEKQLTQADSSISVVGSNADLVIECELSENKPIHLVTVADPTGTEVHQQGDLSVIFRISAPRQKKVVKSDIATSSIDEVVQTNTKATDKKKVFGVTVPGAAPTTVAHKSAYATADEAQKAMVSDVAKRIASYLVNTEQAIVVPLATGGQLTSANKLTDSGLWPRYLEALETMKPYPDAKDDAYRRYNIGVADEALAYQAQDNQSAIKYLNQASVNYGTAIDTKPQEKGFIQAQSRIKAALLYYSDIGKMTELTPGSSLGTGLVAKAPALGELTNKDVVDMVAGHMDTPNIIDSIQNAPAVSFDLSPQGQVALTKSGVPGPVLMAMKQRDRGTAGGPAPIKRH